MTADFEKARKRARISKNVKRVLTYAMLSFWGVIVLFPFYWMILTSVKDYGEYNAERIPKLFTTTPTLENFKAAFSEVPLAD